MSETDKFIVCLGPEHLSGAEREHLCQLCIHDARLALSVPFQHILSSGLTDRSFPSMLGLLAKNVPDTEESLKNRE